MYVFVYGTLRKGDSRFGVLDDCKCIAPEAYLDGHVMLHLGGFPGIVPGDGRIKGEAYEIDEDILSRLDSIEGYRDDDPKHSLYIRKKVTVDDEEGDRVGEVFTYIYNAERWKESDRPYKIIESGDWFEARPPRGQTASSS